MYLWRHSSDEFRRAQSQIPVAQVRVPTRVLRPRFVPQLAVQSQASGTLPRQEPAVGVPAAYDARQLHLICRGEETDAYDGRGTSAARGFGWCVTGKDASQRCTCTLSVSALHDVLTATDIRVQGRYRVVPDSVARTLQAKI